jgi:uncharacterized membrane protein YhhN
LVVRTASRVLLGAYLLVAAAQVLAQVMDLEALYLLTKPLLMPLLLGFLVASAPLEGRLLRATAAALVWSWLGDLALMPEGDVWFLLGLLAFLLAHVCYLVGFATTYAGGPVDDNVLLLVPYAAWFLLLLVVLGPDLGAMLVPVAVYGVVLCAMAALATGVNATTAVGAVVFVVSDSILAATALTDRFAFDGDGAVVMLTYCLGQLLIVLGVLAASTSPRVTGPVTTTPPAS